ncbi:MAG: penicillin-binding protein [Acidobacteriota bacterium]|nr:MAG: penicillin-binding protein [Acidobacteriota bacterium]
MSESRPPIQLTQFQMRLLFLGLLTSMWVLAVGGRLFYLTVSMRDTLQERAELQHQHTLKLDPRRGTIRDRNGYELATSVEVESVFAVPKALSGARLEQTATALASCLSLPRDKIAARLAGDKSFAWLERKANPRTVDCVRDLSLASVGFLAESRRFYPKRSLASQVLGYVGIDNEGMSGVEYSLEEEIRGEPGRRIIWTDARNRRAASRVEARSRAGRSAYLTIDENLQYIAETELGAAIRESRSKSGIALVMRPRTGELLAMASFPSFNPNRYGDYPASHWRNRAVTDVYEPGSTFKIVAAAAALEENVTNEDERIDCGRGMIQVGSRVIRDSHYFDVLTFREVVEKSSNVGMIRIGQRLGKDRLEHYVHAFGFGAPSGIELPGESRGILRAASRWGPVTLASISFGQEIGVTALQMVTAANVVATSGYLMRPRLLLGFGDTDGRLVASFTPEPVRRVIQQDTSRRLKELLVGVVERGTGKRARIEGYRVAGKTGTAQKAVRGGYSKTDYIASFVGFAPADTPELTALVILDSPTGDHSGSRAAAVFARIVKRSLRYLGVAPQTEAPLRVAKLWPQSRPIMEARELRLAEGRKRPQSFGAQRVGGRAREGNASGPAGRAGDGVPDVFGLPARDALARFVSRGVVPEIVGTGNVFEQYPKPGKRVEPGTRARLYLGVHPATPLETVPLLRPSGPVTIAGLRVLNSGLNSEWTRGGWKQRNEIDTRHR